MAGIIATLQDDKGTNIYPQVKADGILDFPEDYLKAADIKKTEVTSATMLNGAGMWSGFTEGLLLELPNGVALFSIKGHLKGLSAANYTGVDIMQFPVAYFNKYKKFVNSPAQFSFTKSSKWVSFEVNTDTGRLQVVPKGSPLSDDECELNFTLYMMK